MTKEEYLKDREALEAKLLKAKDKVDEIAKALEGLELAWKLLGGGSIRTEEAGQRSGVAQAVMGIVAEMESDFTAPDVTDALEAKYPDRKMPFDRSSISGALRRLAGEGALILVEKGAGKRPSVYRRKTPDSRVGDGPIESPAAQLN